MQGQMCELCHRREAKDFWKALVQVRQKVRNFIDFVRFSVLVLFAELLGNGLSPCSAYANLNLLRPTGHFCYVVVMKGA